MLLSSSAQQGRYVILQHARRSDETGSSNSELIIGNGLLNEHASEIDNLLRNTQQPTTARWPVIETWLRHHQDVTPWAVLVRRRGALVAAAILVRASRLGVWQFDTPSESALYSALPAMDEPSARTLAVELAGHLRALHRPWVAHLRYLEVNDPAGARLRRLLPVQTTGRMLTPRVNVDGNRPLNSVLSRNTRSALAKARNRLSHSEHSVSMAWTDDSAVIDATVPEIMELYQQRTIQLGQDARLLADPDHRGYFAEVFHALGASGPARLLTLRLDGELASYAMCLVTGAVMLVYSNRMSPAWTHFSAGAIVNAEVVRSAHADPAIRFVDWGPGLQRYKMSGDVVLHRLEHLHAWSGRATRGAWTVAQRRRHLRGLVTAQG